MFQTELNGFKLGFCALSLAVVCGGCQQLSTYPPVEVTADFQRPAAEPVPTIIAESYRYARDRHLKGESLPINLPENVPAAVYDRVLAHLTGKTNSNAKDSETIEALRPMIFPDERAIHFTEIRTRAMNAQVDLIYPTLHGFNQLVTLTLERSVVEGWRVKSERKWVTRNLAAPVPNFVPAEPEEPKVYSTGPY